MDYYDDFVFSEHGLRQDVYKMKKDIPFSILLHDNIHHVKTIANHLSSDLLVSTTSCHNPNKDEFELQNALMEHMRLKRLLEQLSSINRHKSRKLSMISKVQ